VTTDTQEIYKDLENIDLVNELTERALHVTASGLSWAQLSRFDGVTKSQLLDFYYYMALTRATDKEIAKLSRKGLAIGKHLMCTGNEASAVGSAFALRKDDWATMAIRDLGVFLVRGVPISAVLAQACGRVTGLTGGWDGSLHMNSMPHRIIGLISHLGTMIPIAAGCSFAQKYLGTGNAVLAFSGEGATSTGDFHEGLNIASVLRLPLVIVIENNQWAFGTPSRLQYAVPTLALRARAYGKSVEGYCIDGTDILSVFQTVRKALDHARNCQTISIIETVSMRYEGHSLADPFMTYVPSEQMTTWKTKDPILFLEKLLLAENLATSEELALLDARVRAEVTAAAMEAETGPTPDASDIVSRVFVPSTVCNDATVQPPASGSRITYHQAIHDALQEEMDRDPGLFMIGEDIGISNGAFKITEGFSKRFDHIDWQDYWQRQEPFPQRRVIDTPLGEAGFTGLALGAVQCGLRAIVEYQYADFSSEAFKMIVNYAATQTVRGGGPLPVVFRLPSGRAPHTSIYHSVNPESWFASTPGLKIVSPITAYDAKGLLKAAIRDDNPVLFLEYKAYYRFRPDMLPQELNLPVPESDYVVPIGKARVAREGTDISVITYGSQTVRALEAAACIAKEDGVSVEVIDLRSLVPFDAECIHKSVRKTGRALVTCEAPRNGSFGNTIVTEIVGGDFDHLDAPVRLLAAADTPVPFAPVLEEAHLPTTAKVVAALRALLAY
jgi:2-oxoisovalerate dehydrogenase E1 component